MYRLWQRKHFPLHGFDEALDQVADIGRTNQLKVTSSLSAHCRLPPGPFAACLPQALASPSMPALRPSRSVLYSGWAGQYADILYFGQLISIIWPG